MVNMTPSASGGSDDLLKQNLVDLNTEFQQYVVPVELEPLRFGTSGEGISIGVEIVVLPTVGATGDTLGLKKNPASLPDIRLLALNDVYLFDEKIDDSVAKYFGASMHKLIASNINFNYNRSDKSNKAHAWCLDVIEDPPNDLLSSLKVCTNFLSQAIQQDNEVNLHFAHSLTQLLPVLVAGSNDSSVEDSYVRHYLSPILQSIFSTNEKFGLKWANGALNQDLFFKPDFQVSTRLINLKCIAVVAKFKPNSHNSSIESDLVKLGKQMKLMYNDMVLKKIPELKVCGLLCQGENLYTYMMDMPSP